MAPGAPKAAEILEVSSTVGLLTERNEFRSGLEARNNAIQDRVKLCLDTLIGPGRGNGWEFGWLFDRAFS